MKKEERKIMVRLTDTEIECRGRDLATCLVSKGKLEDARRELNAAIKPLVERSIELSQIIDTGEELRVVECWWEYDWTKGTRVLVNPATGEEIENDIIPEYEKQQHLSL